METLISKSICVIIPARYSSSRLPGKPLVDLCGKPMVIWVAEAAAQAVDKSHVYVATDCNQIAAVVKQYGFQSILTSESALTGTDRVSEAAQNLNYDIFINVQGDEPLVDPADITKAANLKIKLPSYVINGYTNLSADEDPKSLNIPKVVISNSESLIYISRSALPAIKDKKNASPNYLKQVCIYAFSKEELRLFSSCSSKGCLETYEDIEIIRFLELDIPVKMFYCQPNSFAVDVPEDVKPVEYALMSRLT